jgi:hypothetical protein
MNAQDTLCSAVFSIGNNEPMHVQLDAQWADTSAAYTWSTEGAIIAEGASSNVVLYPGIREICLHVETPTCAADSCMWTDVLCTNNTIKFRITSFGDSTGVIDTLNIVSLNALYEVFNYSGFTISTNEPIEWLECIDEGIDCIMLSVTPQTWWQVNADSIIIEAEYISGGDGPLDLQIYQNQNLSHYNGDVLGIDCIWYSVENTDAPMLDIWPNPSADKLHFNQPLERWYIVDLQGRVVSKSDTRTSSISIQELPEGLYVIHGLVGDAWLTTKVIRSAE